MKIISVKCRLQKLGRKYLWLTIFSLLTCFSCHSQPVSLRAIGNISKELEQNGIILTVRFMARGELLARHGPQEKNPFISGRYIFYERYLIVFYIDIKNTTNKSFELQTGTVSMKFDSRLFIPVNIYNFEDYWRLHDVIERANKKNSELKQKLIREYVLPPSSIIEPDGSRCGYIVFMTTELPRHKHESQAILSLPMGVPNKEMVYDFLFYYSFY